MEETISLADKVSSIYLAFAIDAETS